jgi:hypothetical protein
MSIILARRRAEVPVSDTALPGSVAPEAPLIAGYEPRSPSSLQPASKRDVEVPGMRQGTAQPARDVESATGA